MSNDGLPEITIEPQREYLRVLLTDEEKMNAAKSMATAVLQVNTLEAELEGIKKKFKSDIEIQSLKTQRNSELVENGYEYRTVDCEWRKDWAGGIKHLVRLDTGEVVQENVKIEPSERQAEIDAPK